MENASIFRALAIVPAQRWVRGGAAAIANLGHIGKFRGLQFDVRQSLFSFCAGLRQVLRDERHQRDSGFTWQNPTATRPGRSPQQRASSRSCGGSSR